MKSGHPATNVPQAYLWLPKSLVEVQHIKRVEVGVYIFIFKPVYKCILKKIQHKFNSAPNSYFVFCFCFFK